MIAHGFASAATVSSAASGSSRCSITSQHTISSAASPLGSSASTGAALNSTLEARALGAAVAPRRSPRARRRCRGSSGRGARAGSRARPRRSRSRAPRARPCGRRAAPADPGTRPPAAARRGFGSRTCRRRCRPPSPRGGGRAQTPTSLRSRSAARLEAALVGAGRTGARAVTRGLVVGRLDARLELEPADSLEGPLGDHALAGDRVAHHAQPEHLDRGQRQHRAEDQRLDVPGPVAVQDPVDAGTGSRPRAPRRRARRRRS